MFSPRKLLISAATALTLATALAAPASANLTPQLQGSAWLGGQGVPICYKSTDPVCGGQTHVGGVSSNWWQCVEAAQRLYQRRGWYSGNLFKQSNGSTVTSAYQIFDGAARMGMTSQANGSVTSVVPGDMIVMPQSGRDGHVTMVDRVGTNADGSRTIYTVGQNVSNPRLDFRWRGGTIESPWSSYTVRGVVHSPQNGGSVPTPTPQPPSAGPTTLHPGQTLGVGARLVSGDGRYVLTMQGDGNLVEYAPGNRPVWASGTGTPGTVLVNQGDGNLVLVAPGNRAVWATGTNGNPGTVLVVQDDANVVAYAPGNRPVWASGTRV